MPILVNNNNNCASVVNAWRGCNATRQLFLFAVLDLKYSVKIT